MSNFLRPLIALLLIASAVLGQLATTRPAPTVVEPPAAAENARSFRDVRPTLTDDEYAKLAAKLREVYGQGPEQWPAPVVDEGIQWRELGPVPPVEHPADNPHSVAKEELGKRLFFDPRLSGSKQIACASCHDPDLAWADGRTVSFGNERTALRRNAPSLLNAAHQPAQFWDGRARTLEEQALHPITAGEEMHGEPAAVERTLNEDDAYRRAFKDVFGADRVTLADVSRALATFQRSIVSQNNSPFDAFLRREPGALSDAAVRGLHLFRTEARCMNCHHGPLLSDGQFHDLGLSYYGRKHEDLGRHVVTGEPTDVGRFRTPALRNVERTRPYMHNGLFELEGVLNMYNAGMATIQPKDHQLGDPLFPTKSPHLRPLGLNRQDLADLKAFLESLTEPRRRIRPPDASEPEE